MSRSKAYQRLLNSKRWRTLRLEYLRDHPLCERCKREGIAAGIPGGYITAAVDVHHRQPVESAKTQAQMEQLCFQVSNLEALCVPCHILTHKEQHSHTRDAHLQREADRLKQWADRMTKFTTNDNQGTDREASMDAAAKN